MFERFTDRARRAVVHAQDEARRLGHDYIGTEHLLLGLTHDAQSVAAKVLVALGIELADVRARVEESVRPGGEPAGGHIPFTPRVKKSLELSLREALDLGHQHIGTEHLLLGLLHQGEGAGARVLVGLGADLGRAREQVAQLHHTRVARERAVFAQLPGASLTGKLDEVMDRLAAISDRLDSFADRLAAIERSVGGADIASPDGEDERRQ